MRKYQDILAGLETLSEKKEELQKMYQDSEREYLRVLNKL